MDSLCTTACMIGGYILSIRLPMKPPVSLLPQSGQSRWDFSPLGMNFLLVGCPDEKFVGGGSLGGGIIGAAPTKNLSVGALSGLPRQKICRGKPRWIFFGWGSETGGYETPGYQKYAEPGGKNNSLLDADTNIFASGPQMKINANTQV